MSIVLEGNENIFNVLTSLDEQLVLKEGVPLLRSVVISLLCLLLIVFLLQVGPNIEVVIGIKL